MITGRAGGHEFVNGVCFCGRRLVDLRDLTQDDKGKPNIAHSGLSTAYEIEEIIALIKKMDEQMAVVLGWSNHKQEA
jgi:hypothetical protein